MFRVSGLIDGPIFCFFFAFYICSQTRVVDLETMNA